MVRLNRLGIAAVVFTLIVCVVFAYWVVRYDPGDPRSIHYIFWKHRLNANMNLDFALIAMGRDADRDRLVKGLTQDQLQARFGYVRTLEQVSPYYQRCRNASGREDKMVVFLRDSPWMVVMDNQKGSYLVLCKGY